MVNNPVLCVCAALSDCVMWATLSSRLAHGTCHLCSTAGVPLSVHQANALQYTPASALGPYMVAAALSLVLTLAMGVSVPLTQTSLQPDWMAQRLTSHLIDWLELDAQTKGSSAAASK